MNSSGQQTGRYSDEITLKELLQKIGEFWEALWLSKWKIGVITLPFVVFMTFKALVAKSTYSAQLSFTVNEDKGGGIGAMTGVLGQLGFGGSASEYNLDRILDLGKSRKIIQRSLFYSDSLLLDSNILANHLILLYGLNQEWQGDLEGFLFREMQIKSRIDQAALKAVHARVIGNEDIEGLLSSGYDESTGILKLKISSLDPVFSVALCNSVYNQLSNYYIEKAVEPQKTTLANLEQRADSLYQELTAAEYLLARFMDTNRSLISAHSSIKGQRLQRQVAVLSTAYSKVLENLEVAKFSLDNATPFFQIIDKPMLPISGVKVSLFRNVLIGLFLGLFFGCFYVITKKIVADVLA